MNKIIVSILCALFFITGCSNNSAIQSNNNTIAEVVNEHNDIRNLKALHTFIQRAKLKKEDVINYVEYGVEGQRGVMTLTSKKNSIHISSSVDKKFVEEFSCEDIVIDTKNGADHYVLKQCTGDSGVTRDFPLLTVSK